MMTLTTNAPRMSHVGPSAWKIVQLASVGFLGRFCTPIPISFFFGSGADDCPDSERGDDRRTCRTDNDGIDVVAEDTSYTCSKDDTPSKGKSQR